jgi:hypothetical protein
VRKSALLSALGAIVCVAQILSASPASAATTPFDGTWRSIDSDGSHQQLYVHGGAHAVKLYDDAATSACRGTPAMVPGFGSVHGRTLTVNGVLVCLPGGNVLRFRILLEFTYHAASDTLTDSTGVIWHRS